MMPYILLGLGFVIGGAALYRFFLTATRKQFGTLIVVIGTVAVSALVFLLSITGRLPGAVGVIAALWPLFYSVWKSHQQVRMEERVAENLSTGAMGRGEALAILGLTEGATREDVLAAHKRLLKKVHPDVRGSDWLASKINAARDVLIGQ